MCNKANSWNKTNLLTNYRFFINRQFVVRVVELASSGGSWTLGLRVPSTHLQGRKKNRAEKQRTEPLRGCVLLASFGSAALTCFHTEVPPLDVRLQARPPVHPNSSAKALTERNRQGPSLERRGPLTALHLLQPAVASGTAAAWHDRAFAQRSENKVVRPETDMRYRERLAMSKRARKYWIGREVK